MTVHSKIGPSALHRLLACPASHALSQKYPAGGSSVYAAEGTVAHSIIEGELGPIAYSRPNVGDKVDEEGHEITIDQDMLDGVDQMVAFCEPLAAKANKTWVEARVNLDQLWEGNPPEPIFGTVDFAAWISAEDTLYVVDFKYGRLPVSPLDNPQAFAYALGACYELGYFPKNIVVVIVQPRGKDNTPVKLEHISGLDLLLWADNVLKPGVDACFNQVAGYATGDHCRFCPAKIDCPALYELAKKTSRTEFGEMPPNPMNMSDAHLGEVLDQIEILEWWFTQVRAEVSGRIEKGNSVPNWKLVPKRAMRKWDKSQMDKIEEVLFTDGAYYELRAKSPTSIEKIDKKLYDRLVERGLVDATSSGTTLVPQKDPRIAAQTKSAKDEFDAVEPSLLVRGDEDG